MTFLKPTNVNLIEDTIIPESNINEEDVEDKEEDVEDKEDPSMAKSSL
jgi:hypothetical protein